MTSPAENHLPKVVDMIADRIGLDYNIRRKEATEKYVADNNRLDLVNLKNSYYSLGEERTKKANDEVVKIIRNNVKNPLKLNAKVRKQLYKLTPQEKQSLKYSDFEKINLLWCDYAKKVMLHNDPQQRFSYGPPWLSDKMYCLEKSDLRWHRGLCGSGYQKHFSCSQENQQTRDSAEEGEHF